MNLFDTIKSIATQLDPKMFDSIIGNMSKINFAPIISNLESKVGTNAKLATVVNLLKSLSAAKPNTANQLVDITSKFNAKEVLEGLNIAEHMDDLPGMNIISQALKSFIK